MNSKEKINLLYCGDKNIGDGLLLSLLSFMKNNSNSLNVYVLTLSFEYEGNSCEALSREYAEYLDRLLKEDNPESSLTLIDVSDKFIKELPLSNLRTRFTPGCMLRLYADEIEELPSKILYLDNDTICRKDVSDFYFQSIDGKEVVGVLDHYGSHFFRRRVFKRDYLNSGVLLLNLGKIKETGLFRKCRRLCAEKEMFMPDQSAINKLAVAKGYVPRHYNEQRKLRKKTVIQHFTTHFRMFPYIHTVTAKPWQIDRVHRVLKIKEYDGLFEEYERIKKCYEITSKGERL